MLHQKYPWHYLSQIDSRKKGGSCGGDGVDDGSCTNMVEMMNPKGFIL